MGKQSDGTVIPTPRDRVTSAEAVAYYESILARGPVAFEIYYGDESVVAGSTIQQWQQAPNTDVQFVIVLFADYSIELVQALDTYGLAGLTKTGTWMDDTLFFDMRDNLYLTSDIMRGNTLP